MSGPVPLWDTDDNGVPLWQLLDALGPDATEDERRAVMTEVVTGRRVTGTRSPDRERESRKSEHGRL
jgi:hypothetical protein